MSRPAVRFLVRCGSSIDAIGLAFVFGVACGAFGACVLILLAGGGVR